MNEINKLEKSIQEYIERTSKKDYKFTFEEQIQVQNLIEILDKHVDMLIDYEIERGNNEKVNI